MQKKARCTILTILNILYNAIQVHAEQVAHLKEQLTAAKDKLAEVLTNTNTTQTQIQHKTPGFYKNAIFHICRFLQVSPDNDLSDHLQVLKSDADKQTMIDKGKEMLANAQVKHNTQRVKHVKREIFLGAVNQSPK